MIGRRLAIHRIPAPYRRFHVRAVAAAVLALAALTSPAFSQTGAPKASETTGNGGSGTTAHQREAREFAEAAATLKGAAGHPECVWLGRRIIALLLRDDLDTAMRHLNLYDRFGCPRNQIQTSFRCLIRQGTRIDPKVDPKIFEKLDARTLACWLNPGGRQAAGPADASGPSAITAK